MQILQLQSFITSFLTSDDVTSLSVVFIGDFRLAAPSFAIINSTLKFFEDAKALGKFSDEYQVNTRFSEGHKFLEIIKKWDHYPKSWLCPKINKVLSSNRFRCLNCQLVMAQSYCRLIFSETLLTYFKLFY